MASVGLGPVCESRAFRVVRVVGELARRGCLGPCVGEGDPDLLLAVPDKVRGVVGELVLPPRARIVGDAALMPGA